MPALYNEIDPFAAQWTRNLIAAGHVAPGTVDERSVEALTPADVAGPGQRHFFSGIAGWSYALRRAGIPDTADVWTGSCPCQGLSDAGQRRGFLDPRHLWPAWFSLIEQCRPPVIFGEQVASRLGLEWLDLVFADLERCGYTVGSADLCAAGVGAPHIRQRLFFVAYAHDGVADAERERGGPGRQRRSLGRSSVESDRHGATGLVADSASEGRQGTDQGADRGGFGRAQRDSAESRRDSAPGFWSNADWIPCTDGVSRPVEPGTFPLAHGLPARVGRLRGYGNAICTEVAVTFIQASVEALSSIFAKEL